jgi:hypothetical protein
MHTMQCVLTLQLDRHVIDANGLVQDGQPHPEHQRTRQLYGQLVPTRATKCLQDVQKQDYAWHGMAWPGNLRTFAFDQRGISHTMGD